MHEITLLIRVTWYDDLYGSPTFPRNYCIHTTVPSLECNMEEVAQKFFPPCIEHYKNWIANDQIEAALELVLLGHVAIHPDYEYYTL